MPSARASLCVAYSTLVCLHHSPTERRVLREDPVGARQVDDHDDVPVVIQRGRSHAMMVESTGAPSTKRQGRPNPFRHDRSTGRMFQQALKSELD